MEREWWCVCVCSVRRFVASKKKREGTRSSSITSSSSSSSSSRDTSHWAAQFSGLKASFIGLPLTHSLIRRVTFVFQACEMGEPPKTCPRHPFGRYIATSANYTRRDRYPINTMTRHARSPARPCRRLMIHSSPLCL